MVLPLLSSRLVFRTIRQPNIVGFAIFFLRKEELIDG
jgi:hypothetical protein